MQDLVGVTNRLFGEVLPHTPLTAVGLNIEEIVDFGSFEKRNRLGRKLAPVDSWGDWAAAGFDNDDFRLNGGMMSLIMRKPINYDPLEYTELKVEPCNDPDIRETGVYFQCHFHFGMADGAEPPEDWNQELLTCINEKWKEFQDITSQLVEQLESVVDE